MQELDQVDFDLLLSQLKEGVIEDDLVGEDVVEQPLVGFVVAAVVGLFEDEMKNAVIHDFEVEVFLLVESDAVPAGTECYVVQVHHN